MTSPNGIADVVEGIVESANDHGIKVQGEWRNVSKFKPIDLPERGARVRCELDAKGFLRSCQVLDGGPSSTSSSSPTRDRTITRLAVLKAASNFLGLMSQSSEEVRSDHVLMLADRWLAWVEQPEKGEDAEPF